MPGTFFAIGSVSIVRPAPGTGDSVYSCTEIDGPHPAVERLQRLTYSGVNGQAVKKLGKGAQSGTVKGFIDASSAANLGTAKATLDGLCSGQTAGTASFFDAAFTVSNVIVTDVKPGAYWGYGARVCLNFELTWESTG